MTGNRAQRSKNFQWIRSRNQPFKNRPRKIPTPLSPRATAENQNRPKPSGRRAAADNQNQSKFSGRRERRESKAEISAIP